MRFLRLALSALFVVLLAAPAAAQEPDSGEPFLERHEAAIPTFATIAWGQGQDAIVAEWGPADTTVSAGNFGQLLMYINQMVGNARGVLMGFVVHPEYGLLRGFYSSAASPKTEAEGTYRHWRTLISDAYPSIEASDVDECSETRPQPCTVWVTGKSSIRLEMTPDETGWTAGATYSSWRFLLMDRELNRRRFGGD